MIAPFRRCLTIALFLSTSALYLRAQTAPPRIIDFNNHLWLNYSGEHAVTQRWGLHFDGQWRRSDFGSDWQQYLLRPAVNFQLSKDVIISVGYVFARTYPYGDSPVAKAFPENRAYEQLQVAKRVRGLPVVNRSRFEQRFVRYPNQTNWTYQNRFRHLLRVEVPIGRPDNPKRWYVPVYDEIFLGIAPNYGARPFDQNRLAAGIGKANGPIKFEAVYMNQFLGQRNGRVFEFDNTLVLSVISSARLPTPWGH